ncbi:hypothetical protein HK100_005616 [Physocladia obscura]|uniref:Uncharacterized protein n=1 Tax=Physocladia obscura TaxID=109957 RepID=A0AAD5T6Q5_9FUNG|nr:hypothetical protein HK100_005616 [Physocladia obscura]
MSRRSIVWAVDPKDWKDNPGDSVIDEDDPDKVYSIERILGHATDAQGELLANYKESLKIDGGSLASTSATATPRSVSKKHTTTAASSVEPKVKRPKPNINAAYPSLPLAPSAAIALQNEHDTMNFIVDWSTDKNIKPAIHVLSNWDIYVNRVKRMDNKGSPGNKDKLLYRVIVEFKLGAMLDGKTDCIMPLGLARSKIPQSMIDYFLEICVFVDKKQQTPKNL